jgi:ADP-glucose pyrophosphorylase
VLLRGVRVGQDAIIDSSIIGHDAMIGREASIAQMSIVGDGAEIAVGSKLAASRVPDVAPSLKQ